MQSMSTMALFSSSPTTIPTLSSKIHLFPHKQAKVSTFSLPKRTQLLFLARSADNGAGVVIEEKEETKKVEEEKKEVKKEEPLRSNGTAAAKEEVLEVPKFKDARWVGGTWDLEQFKKGGVTDWDAVIDAEARRRKWLQDSPETSTNDEPVVFNSSIIPWWAWMKRFHLPEAEKLNGRAAMIGFFMAYFVDSLTGVGLVDQMGNFFCKTLLLVAVSGVLFIRKNEDLETLKKLWEETTFYDKQWQATWKEDSSTNSRKE